MKIPNKQANMLIELIIALSIGIFVILQLTAFMLPFIKRLHEYATIERQALCDGVALDLLMRDLDAAVNLAKEKDNLTELITINRWYVSIKKNEITGVLTPIIWSRVQGRLQRKAPYMSAAQVFGNVLPELDIDIKNRTMRFINEQKKMVAIRF